MVFDPTGLQAIPANSNSQRLGVGGPVADIIKIIIKTNKGANVPGPRMPEPKRDPQPKSNPKAGSKV